MTKGARNKSINRFHKEARKVEVRRFVVYKPNAGFVNLWFAGDAMLLGKSLRCRVLILLENISGQMLMVITLLPRPGHPIEDNARDILRSFFDPYSLGEYQVWEITSASGPHNP